MLNAFPLSPVDNNYLTSFLIFNQLTQNARALTLLAGVTADTTTGFGSPQLKLDGQGRGYLDGYVEVTAGAPAADFPFARLPTHIRLDRDAILPVVVIRAGAYIPNAVRVVGDGAAIVSVNVSAGGQYDSLPAVVLSDNGAGPHPEFVVHMEAFAVTVETAQSGAGSYAPTDTITLNKINLIDTAIILDVLTTKVVSATVAAGGTGGTDGVQLVTGTTGTGTKFQAVVTIVGGSITAVNSIELGGSYTVNPTLLTAEPVTGAGLVGATLNIKMGVLTIAINTAGDYTALPVDPLTQAATSGTGTGATFNVVWSVLAVDVVPNGATGFIPSTTAATVGGDVIIPAALSLTLGASGEGEIQLVTAPLTGDFIYLDAVRFFPKSYTEVNSL